MTTQAETAAADALISTDVYPSSRYAWFVVICLQMAYAVAIMDRQILALLVQPIKADLKISDTQFSLLAGLAFVMCYSSLGLAFGRLADRRNRRNILLGGLVVWSFASIGCGLARTFGGLFLARAFVGVGEAALNPAAYSIIADCFPKKTRSRAISLYTMGSYTGAGFGLLVSALALTIVASRESIVLPVVGLVRSWQAVFILVGLIPGSLVALALLAVKEPSRKEVSIEHPGENNLRRFLNRKAGIIALIIIAFALNGLTYYGIGTWTPAIFIRKFHWPAARIGFALGMVQMAMGSAGIIAGGWWISRRQSVKPKNYVFTTVRNVLLFCPFFVMLAGLSSSATLSLIGVGLLVFTVAIVSGQSAVALFEVTPNMFRGQVVAAYILTGTLLGFGIGTTLIASITDHVFHNENAVGASLAIAVTGSALIAALSIHFASRSKELSMDW